MKYAARLLIASSIAAMLSYALAAETTSAASYDVYSCTLPNGTSGGSRGWTKVETAPGFSVDLDCQTGPIGAWVDEHVVHARGQWGGLRFAAPSGIHITGYSAHFTQDATASPDFYGWGWLAEVRGTLVGQTEPSNLGVCPGSGGYCQSRTILTPFLPMPAMTSMDWSLRCDPRGGSDCPAGSRASVAIESARFRLEDADAPSLSATPTGSLFDREAPLTGVREIAFEATDQGSGVYRAALEVDGAIVAERVVDPNGGLCSPPYTSAVPCKAKASGVLAFDTAELADGTHDGRLLVYDATRVNVVSYGPFTFESRNRTVASMCDASPASYIRFGTPKKPIRYGRRLRLKGVAPLPEGSEVVALEGNDQLWISARSGTGAGGRFEVVLPPGTTRSVRLGIRPLGSRGRYACSSPFVVKVAARITLSVGPKELRNGHAIFIRGMVAGGEPAARKGVVVQARARRGRRWATVRVVRTDIHGRYRLHYTFRNTWSPVTYEFRSQVREERGFPYSLGISPKRRVRVVP